MADVQLKEIKKDFYIFLEAHRERLRLANYQFGLESGTDLNKSFTWFSRDEKIEEARMYAEMGTYPEYFLFCLNENFFTLQMGDGSLVQIHLRASKEGALAGGSLAFLPRPENGFEYFRFDCEPTEARNYRHNRYHAHFGFHAKNMRISVFQFPWPSEFIAFIGHLMSDRKGRTVMGSDFLADVEITGFHDKHLLPNLNACNEKYNHSLSFFCTASGGTRLPNLKSPNWEEQI